MNRRDFLRYGSAGAAGFVLNGANLGWLVEQAQAQSQAAGGTPWKFGVMSDTQWSNKTTDPANPATCAVDIIQALNQQFINHGCKFVLQCGDLCNDESWTIPTTQEYSNYSDPFGYTPGTTKVRTMQYRAWAAQALYDAGIGFYPCRGNHEATQTAAVEFPALFPQTQGAGQNVLGADNFQASANPLLTGLSYAFDFDNVRIVIIDQFMRPGPDGTSIVYSAASGAEVVGTGVNDCAVDQVGWVNDVLSGSGRTTSDMHAFVMSHKNLAGQNHKDNLFGGSVGANPDARDDFISVMDSNKVGYYLGGHDHQHYRSRLTVNGYSAEQIITSSNSYKFYTPKSPYQQAGLGELAVAHELYTIGYYIFTVDGPCLTVDFYSSSHGQDYGDFGLNFAPENYTFYLRESFGYSLNGKSFEVAHGDSYTSVEDSFESTVARILDGFNGNTETVYGGAAPVKTVKTGWKPMPDNAASAVLYLWGLQDNLSLHDKNLTGELPDSNDPGTADPYVLSMSFESSRMSLRQLRAGKFGIKAQFDGAWLDAVDLNVGGSKSFVYGAYNGHPLGSHGVDPRTMTAWAVINHDSQFVVM
ncbi:metallophosphoesterase family protein [Thiocystis violascens]|uniref:Calcineurin-like phosphoesterase domain-containing protein n=1 Tax=Thiocystis violascens (strain ATCC 17096 / DSM 198 / 6111) TaxID=765911 RepID=I3YC41_THIV6|nr:metallophosphoesterase [Thiocystis violascens]AFL74559.1 hypothetical protein Thivi_2626 [Thiocystis violascens DSM 198]